MLPDYWLERPAMSSSPSAEAAIDELLSALDYKRDAPLDVDALLGRHDDVETRAHSASRTASYCLRMATARRRTSDWPALIVFLILAVAVVGVSAWVGFVGAPGEVRYDWGLTHFDWGLAAVFGTGLGTTLLATATGWLAWSTRSEVRATQDLAELTREQQAANDRPVVIQRRVNWNPAQVDATNGRIEIELANVGIGPALRVRVKPSYHGHEEWRPSFFVDDPAVATISPDTAVTVGIEVMFPTYYTPEGGVKEDGFQATGTYLDRSMVNLYEVITTWPED